LALFITFEGGEGSGKSTQARRLYRRLQNLAVPVILTHEPGVTPLGKKITRLLKWRRDNVGAGLESFWTERLQAHPMGGLVEVKDAAAQAGLGLDAALEAAMKSHATGTFDAGTAARTLEEHGVSGERANRLVEAIRDLGASRPPALTEGITRLAGHSSEGQAHGSGQPRPDVQGSSLEEILEGGARKRIQDRARLWKNVLGSFREEFKRNLSIREGAGSPLVQHAAFFATSYVFILVRLASNRPGASFEEILAEAARLAFSRDALVAFGAYIATAEISQAACLTLQEVECLGSCGTAPVMLVDDVFYENLDPAKVDDILSDLKLRDEESGDG